MQTQRTSSRKRILILGILLVIFIICIISDNIYKHYHSSDVIIPEPSQEDSSKSICEKKLISEFQLIEPEITWIDVTDSKLIGDILFLSDGDNYEKVRFSCRISNNGKDAWIDWDINSEDDMEEIYDDREEGVDNSWAEVEARFDDHLGI